MSSEELGENGVLVGATAVVWSKRDPFGAEYAEVTFGRDTLSASGIAIGSEPLPYRLEYALRTISGFIAAEVEVVSRGDGWARRLMLVRSAAGEWSADATSRGETSLPPPGGETAAFGRALDPDLGLSPLFNSMPVLRHGLHDGGTAEDFLMIWISVPDLSIYPSRQRYTFLERLADGNRLVRFESVGVREDFVADVVFDPKGLVVDYPGIASRIR